VEQPAGQNCSQCYSNLRRHHATRDIRPAPSGRNGWYAAMGIMWGTRHSIGALESLILTRLRAAFVEAGVSR
jgi:hypothetical protein